MQKKGITREKIYEAATELVVEKGYDSFSLRELAARLDVQPASLYSHVKNVREISVAVGQNAIAKMSAALEEAVDRGDADEAFAAFARAYRRFAHENPALYRAVMALPEADEEELRTDEQRTIAPLRRLVERYAAEKTDVINGQRFLRSALHGFVMLEADGFLRDRSVPADESFDMLVEACLAVFKQRFAPGGERADA